MSVTTSSSSSTSSRSSSVFAGGGRRRPIKHMLINFGRQSREPLYTTTVIKVGDEPSFIGDGNWYNSPLGHTESRRWWWWGRWLRLVVIITVSFTCSARKEKSGQVTGNGQLRFKLIHKLRRRRSGVCILGFLSCPVDGVNNYRSAAALLFYPPASLPPSLPLELTITVYPYSGRGAESVNVYNGHS